jgi:hypothetical protein
VFLSFHIIQHPDVAGNLCHGDHQPVVSEREPNCIHGLRNHRFRLSKCGYLEWITCRCALRRIEVNPPDIEEATAFREEINDFAVGRPAGLVVPVFTIRYPNPRPASHRQHIDRRHKPHGLVFYGLKNNPATIGGVVATPQIAGWIRTISCAFPFASASATGNFQISALLVFPFSCDANNDSPSGDLTTHVE